MNYDNQWMEVDGTRIGYRVEGGGGPPFVVLLHGLNSHSGTWRKTFPALTGRFSVLAPSLPPHTGAISGGLVDSYALLVTRMLERLGIRSAAVVGNSMGGWLGVRLASGAPDPDLVVHGLVLEDTAGTRSEDLSSVLRRRGTRTMIVWGESDELIPVDYGRRLHSQLPGSRLEVLQGVGHVPHWEDPDRFNLILRDFLA